jgi:hypothetical protein
MLAAHASRSLNIRLRNSFAVIAIHPAAPERRSRALLI